MTNIFNTKEKGVTLFIAMVVTAALLVISTGIVTLAVREARISNAARESQKAFYAADTGIECALYWDQKYTGNSSHSAFDPAARAGSITCDDSSWSLTYNSATSTFTIDDANFCVTVDIGKYSRTLIESHGRNSCDVSKSRRVERALRVTY